MKQVGRVVVHRDPGSDHLVHTSRMSLFEFSQRSVLQNAHPAGKARGSSPLSLVHVPREGLLIHMSQFIYLTPREPDLGNLTCMMYTMH